MLYLCINHVLTRKAKENTTRARFLNTQSEELQQEVAERMNAAIF